MAVILFFNEQIETSAHDAGTLCRHIAELFQRLATAPASPVNVAINAGFGGQSSPHSNPVLKNHDLKSTLQASLGHPVDYIAPAKTHVLYEARFGAAKTSGVACSLYAD